MRTRFSARLDRPCGPPSLQYNGYRVFPGSKERPGRAADHSPLSSAAVTEGWSYTSTHPLGYTGPVTGTLYLFTSYALWMVSAFPFQSSLANPRTRCPSNRTPHQLFQIMSQSSAYFTPNTLFI